MAVPAQFANSVAANVAYWRTLSADASEQSLKKLDRERHNLFRAADFGLGLSETWRAAAELILQCFQFVERRGYWRDWIPVLERLLSNYSDQDLALKGHVLDQLGIFYTYERRWEAAIAAHEEEERIGLELRDEQRLAFARMHLCEVFWRQRDYDRARRYGQLALKGFSSIDAGKEKLAACHNVLGLVAQESGQLAESEKSLRRAITLYRQVDEPDNLARSLKNLANTLESDGRADEALARYQEAAALLAPGGNELEKLLVELGLGTLYFNQGQLSQAEAAFRRADSAYLKEAGPPYHRGMALMNLANVLLVLGRLEEADSHWRQSIELLRRSDGRLMLANSLSGLAETMVALGKPEQAVPLYEEAIIIASDYPDSAFAQRLLKRFRADLKELRNPG